MELCQKFQKNSNMDIGMKMEKSMFLCGRNKSLKDDNCLVLKGKDVITTTVAPFGERFSVLSWIIYLKSYDILQVKGFNDPE